jgi:ribose transport system permease protein
MTPVAGENETDAPERSVAVANTQEAPSNRTSASSPAALFLERYGLVGLFIVVIAVFSAMRPHTFATLANWQAIGTSQAVLGIAALALIIPLVGGRFDVSVGSNLGLCAIVCSGVMSKDSVPLVPAILIAVAIGGILGLINGAIVAYLARIVQ